jgi:predicted amidophosphoribosyltransferase
VDGTKPTGGPTCHLCGRPTYDPDKRERPWARGVAGGRQVLVCPVCQAERPGWGDALERCARCGSTRLSVMLGRVVCRACGNERELSGPG